MELLGPIACREFEDLVMPLGEKALSFWQSRSNGKRQGKHNLRRYRDFLSIKFYLASLAVIT